MVSISGYTIDLVASVSDQDLGTELSFFSGLTCRIPKSDPRVNAFAHVARIGSNNNIPLALRIIDHLVVDVATYTYKYIDRIDPDSCTPSRAKIWLVGRSGPCDFVFHEPDAENQYRLLTQSLATRCMLFFLFQGSRIVSVTELSPEQRNLLTTLGAIRPRLEPLLPIRELLGKKLPEANRS